MSKALSYRRFVESDQPLIREGFISSFRTAHAAGLIAMDDWHDVMSRQWQKILDRPGTEVFVAYHPGEDSTTADLYGFIAVERQYQAKIRGRMKPCPFVIYIYVKHNFRKQYGIARGLFAAAGIDPTEKFHYAAKTGCLGELKGAIPRAEWKPIAMRYPPQ